MRYVVLLRAVNVGGRNRVPMAEFRGLLADLGHKKVGTFIQSGNGLFSSGRTDTRVMEEEIEEAIARQMAVQTTAFIRSREDLAVLIDLNPFDVVPGLHVTFLSEHPDVEALAALDPAQFEPDRYQPGDRALYLVYPNGVQGSKLTQALIERRLGVKATARNWNTVNKLLALTQE